MINVVLATHNGARTLPRMLERLCELHPPPDGWRLIAVNNASTDATPEILRQYRKRLPLTVLEHGTKGKNSALNAAIPAIDGSLVVLTDDDILPERDWLLVYRDTALAHPDHSVFGGPIRPDWPSEPPAWILKPADHLGVSYGITDPALPQGDVSPKLIWGGNMMVRKAVFDAGHRFSDAVGPKGGTAYAMGGETEFLDRLEAAGYRCRHEPAAAVRHIIRPEQLERTWLLKRAYRYGKSCAHSAFAAAGPSGAHRKLYFDAPRWLYRKIATSAVKACLRGAPLGSSRSFPEMWSLYRALGFLAQYRELAARARRS